MLQDRILIIEKHLELFRDCKKKSLGIQRVNTLNVVF